MDFENKWLWQTDFKNLFILFKRGKDVLSHEIVLAHLPFHWGLAATLQGKNLLPWRANSFL